MTGARQLTGPALGDALRDSRARTLAWATDLTDLHWQVPQQPGINPIAWELAHIAWFAEFWALRGPHTVDAQGRVLASRPAVHAGPDVLFDSSQLAHADRWAAALPKRAQVLDMLAAQLDACIAVIPAVDDDAALYSHRLALFHEDMHGEAFAWLRASLGYPPPHGVELAALPPPATLAVQGGVVRLGSVPAQRGFAFDNEQPGRELTLPGFEIDARTVSAGEYLRFVESGGYDHPAYWPGEAGTWRAQSAIAHPARWRRDPQGLHDEARWQVRWFDRWAVLDPSQPMIHINAFEAEAYCLWAGRRLPSAAQWEHAAHSTPGFIWGRSVWEWTSDAFAPYPGFQPGPYRDYSAPWFGNHRELRGGALVTHERLHDARYRNFFMAQRTDVFAGFRTVAGHR